MDVEPFMGPPRHEDVLPVNIAPRVLTPQNAYLMRSMMMEVIQRGTGQRAKALGRSDLAGKTGTSNDQQDAWFSGYTPDLVASVWVGFDKPKPLGARETGGRAALPMWIEFMRTGLQGLPEHALEQSPGLVTVRIDPETGLLAGANNPVGIFETFRSENVPMRRTEDLAATVIIDGRETTTSVLPDSGGVPEELF